MGQGNEESQIYEICIEYIKEIANYLNAQLLEIGRFFQTAFQWAMNIWEEKIPDTFTITKEQYAILIICCLVLCFHRTKRKKNNFKKQQEEIRIQQTAQRIAQTLPKGPRVLGKNWYPTGWTYNEVKKLWEPPDFLVSEARERWVWDPEKEIWIDLYKQKK